MPFCSSCGAKYNEGDARFCAQCGKPTSSTSSPSQGFKNNASSNARAYGEKCPLCQGSVSSADLGTIVVGGALHHRSCWEQSQGKKQTTTPSFNTTQFNAEKCPGCGGVILTGQVNTAEIIVKSGQQWHRNCVNLSNYHKSTPIVSGVNNSEKCPGCNGVIMTGQVNTAEIIVQSGQQWHRKCVNLSGYHKSTPIVSGVNNSEHCPGCGGIIMTGQVNTADIIVKSGQQWHRNCVNLSGYHKTHTPSQVSNSEFCSACGNQILPHQEKVIKLGNPIHRGCFGGV